MITIGVEMQTIQTKNNDIEKIKSKLHFSEVRATEAASYLMSKCGGIINYTKLLKLLYLADRRSLLERERPITFDTYVVMDNGPVLSQTYDLIKEIDLDLYFWNKHITRKGYNVALTEPVKLRLLSRSDIKILDAIFTEYGHFTYSELIEICHKLPEYRRPKDGTSVDLSTEKILTCLGFSSEIAESIVDSLDEDEELRSLLGWNIVEDASSTG